MGQDNELALNVAAWRTVLAMRDRRIDRGRDTTGQELGHDLFCRALRRSFNDQVDVFFAKHDHLYCSHMPGISKRT